MDMSKSKDIIKDRMLGSLYGFVIGDAMGATTEFMSKQQIKKQYNVVDDIIGGGWLNLSPGQVTDDTQMSICVMDAIMDSNNYRQFNDNVVKNFIQWFDNKPIDVGNQCAKGILAWKYGRPLLKTDSRNDINERGLGNGGLMRCLPCALYNNIDYNISQNCITHPDAFCVDIVKLYHNDIVNLVYGDGDSFYNSPYTELLLEPTGHVFNTINNAYYWSSKESFEQSIIGAVNDGGDADTIGAITGSFAGARFGFKSIPKKWLDKLDRSTYKKISQFCDFVLSYYENVV